MRESWSRHMLSRQLLSLAFVVASAGLLVAPPDTRGEQPRPAAQSNSAQDMPLSYAASAPYYGGAPSVYDPALLASYYNVDPALVTAATMPYYQSQDPYSYTIDLTSFQQPNRNNAGLYQQEYLMEPGVNPYRQASVFEGPNDGRGGPAPQAVPSISYNAAPGLSVYGTPDPYHGSGGVRFSPSTPPWLTGFETGVYANDDELLFSLGGVFKIWEGTHSAIGARILGNAATFHNGQGKVGFSLDIWGATEIEVFGIKHLLKVGGLWDQQEDLHRGGFTVGGILFPHFEKAPSPTFDLAFGYGGGQDFWSGFVRQVADYDAQIRMGFVFFDILRVGASLQYWEWNNPAFDRTDSTAGGYVQVDLGQWMVTGDVQASDDSAQGFVNVVWMPHRRRPPAHSPCTVNVTSSNWSQRYRSWMTAAPLRDLALRTSEAPKAGRQPKGGNPFLIRGQFTVACQLSLAVDRNGNGLPDGFKPANVPLIGDPEVQPDVVELNVTITNGTNTLVNNVSAGNSAVAPVAPAIDPASQTQALNIPVVTIMAINDSISTNDANATPMQFQIGGNAATGGNSQQTTVTFDIMVNGQTTTKTLLVTEGQPLPGPTIITITP